MTTEYQEPQRIRIGHHDKLYSLEEDRNRVIERCAREWAKIRGIDDGRYWVETLPQALFDTLEAYDPRIATLAAVAFIKLHPQYAEQRLSGWRSLKDDPPGSEHTQFFIGSSEGGRTELVFTWPHPKTGKPAFWKSGKNGNFVLDWDGADVWHPGPPPIPGSAVGNIQLDREIGAAQRLLQMHGYRVEKDGEVAIALPLLPDEAAFLKRRVGYLETGAGTDDFDRNDEEDDALWRIIRKIKELPIEIDEPTSKETAK